MCLGPATLAPSPVPARIGDGVGYSVEHRVAWASRSASCRSSASRPSRNSAARSDSASRSIPAAARLKEQERQQEREERDHDRKKRSRRQWRTPMPRASRPTSHRPPKRPAGRHGAILAGFLGLAGLDRRDRSHSGAPVRLLDHRTGRCPGIRKISDDLL